MGIRSSVIASLLGFLLLAVAETPAIAQGPQEIGAWSLLHNWGYFPSGTPTVNHWLQAVHAIMLTDGRVLCFPYHDTHHPFIWLPPAIGAVGTDVGSL